jgi:hypothetical protein
MLLAMSTAPIALKTKKDFAAAFQAHVMKLAALPLPLNAEDVVALHSKVAIWKVEPSNPLVATAFLSLGPNDVFPMVELRRYNADGRLVMARYARPQLCFTYEDVLALLGTPNIVEPLLHQTVIGYGFKKQGYTLYIRFKGRGDCLFEVIISPRNPDQE